MFVHMRCLEMLKQGVEIVVYVPSTIAHTYVYEGITVNCLPSKDIIKHLTNKDKLYLHLLNIYPFSKKNGWIIYKHILDKHIPAVFYVHGSEVQKYGSRIFEFRYRIKDFLIWLKKDFLVIPKMKVFVKTALKRENIKFIYPSIWMKEDMEVNLGVAIPYFKIIPNGIDVDLFSYQETYENRYKMLTLRPLSSKKYAVDIAIKIMSFLPNNYTLDIYGKGFYKKQYLEQIKALKLEDRIKINSSFIDRNDLNSFFSKYGVFLCPTRMDAQGVTMCEAMATGLLTVSSLNTAIPEFITHLDNGIIGNNLEAIAKNIIDNTESMEKYKNITIRARKSMENIAIHKTVAREIEVFCKL
ncbi:glycosyl transferase group 1 [Cellulophaga lytica DSM 7489]|uniref:Glycosyl transferase group 1 n=2 Tax=Cellulophaga lytica TaxID=979 RepID=F0RHE4_CELLC|nr:glycosyl transferase group 1 [Cellulophaga lytica DSM 7489]